MSRMHHDREVFPHVEERIGEDPARFLDREILVTSSLQRFKRREGRSNYVPDTATGDPLEFIASRIRGIDRLEVIGAWQAVEYRLIRTEGDHWRDQGGRDKIHELLQERARNLRAIGERPERLTRREVVVEDGQDDDEDLAWRHEACGSTDVEQESKMAWYCHACEQRTNRVERVEPEAVAA